LARRNEVDKLLALIKLEMAERASSTSITTGDRGKWHAVFHLSCQEGLVTVLHTLLASHLTLDVNIIEPKTGWTGLMLAAAHGHMDVVKFLMQYPQINPNAKGTVTYTISTHINLNHPTHLHHHHIIAM
jgi:hypothetical protein